MGCNCRVLSPWAQLPVTHAKQHDLWNSQTWLLQSWRSKEHRSNPSLSRLCQPKCLCLAQMGWSDAASWTYPTPPELAVCSQIPLWHNVWACLEACTSPGHDPSFALFYRAEPKPGQWRWSDTSRQQQRWLHALLAHNPEEWAIREEKLFGQDNAELSRKSAVTPLLFWFWIKKEKYQSDPYASIHTEPLKTCVRAGRNAHMVSSFIAVLIGSRTVSGKNWGWEDIFSKRNDTDLWKEITIESFFPASRLLLT